MSNDIYVVERVATSEYVVESYKPCQEFIQVKANKNGNEKPPEEMIILFIFKLTRCYA